MNEYAASLLRYLGQTTLEASLLIGLILVARVLLRERLSPRWQYALWFLVCIKILLPWTPYSAVSLSCLIPDTLTSPAHVNPALPASEETSAQSTVSMAWGLWSAVMIWLSGMGVIGTYLLRDYHRMTRLVNHCPTLTARPVLALLQDCCDQLHIRTRVRLVITDAVQSPALLGMTHPRLLLPKAMIRTFTRRQLRHVFLHELAHLKRHDIAASCVASLCHLIHWFNPLVWYAFQQMRTDRELACDQVALTQLAQSEQSTLYGQTIIRILQFNRCHPLRAAMAGMGQTRHQVRKRIVSIAEFQPASEGIHWGAACLLACLAVTGLTRTHIPRGNPDTVTACILAEDMPATAPPSLDTSIVPPVETAPAEAAAQDTPVHQEHTAPLPKEPQRQRPIVSAQDTTFSSQQDQQDTFANETAAMNVQMWYQIQRNAMQFQDFQQRLYRQATLQRQQAARQFAAQTRLQRRQTTPNTTSRRRRHTTSDGIAGIVEIAAIQATHNNRAQ